MTFGNKLLSTLNAPAATRKKPFRNTGSPQQLEAAPVFTPEPLEAMTNAWIADNGYKSGLLYNAVRLALVGEAKGPHLFDIAELLGKEETLYRIRQAIDVLH